MNEREQTLWLNYAKAARAAGVPEDQFRNYARAGFILTPKQLQFAAACREADKKNGPSEIGFGGARGGGKSASLIAQIGLDDCQRRAGLKCLILRKAAKSNLENFQDNRLKIFSNIDHAFIPSQKLMTFPNGSRILIGHFQNDKDIDNYLGLEYDVIGIEEATTLTAQKQKDIKTCNRTSKLDWRPRIYCNTNPGGVSHAYFKTRFIMPYRAKKETVTRFIPSIVTDNPWNNPDYVEVLNELTGWKRRAWRDGDWDVAAGQYFTNFSIEKNVEPANGVDEKRAREWFMGFDYGFNHYTVFLLGFQDGDGNIFVVDEHAERMMLPGSHAELVREMLARHKIGMWSQAHGSYQYAPLELHHINKISAGPDVFSKQEDGRTIADAYEDLGIRLELGHVHRINGWSEILQRLGDERIKPKLFIHERCKRLIEQLPQLIHDPNKPEDVLKVDIDEDGNGGDDCADALRVMIATKVFGFSTTKLKGF